MTQENGVVVRAERLAAIRQRAEAATPGPWSAHEHGMFKTWEVWDTPDFVISYCVCCAEDGHGIDNEPDATFIAEARSDIPWLLAEIERLEGELRKTQDEIIAIDPMKDARAEIEIGMAEIHIRIEDVLDGGADG